LTVRAVRKKKFQRPALFASLLSVSMMGGTRHFLKSLSWVSARILAFVRNHSLVDEASDAAIVVLGPLEWSKSMGPDCPLSARADNAERRSGISRKRACA